MVARGGGEGEGALLLNTYRVTVLQDGRNSGDWPYGDVNALGSLELHVVTFMLCVSYHNFFKN